MTGITSLGIAGGQPAKNRPTIGENELPTVYLPNNWQPRRYQYPLWDYLQKGGKRAVMIAHRRWGKDDVMLHNSAIQAMTRPAGLWHCLPEYEQARKAIRLDDWHRRFAGDSPVRSALFRMYVAAPALVSAWGAVN